MGHYDGYSVNNGIPNGHTIIKLDTDEVLDEFYKLVDKWFDGNVCRFRAGSCFGVGALRHRSEDRLFYIIRNTMHLCGYLSSNPHVFRYLTFIRAVSAKSIGSTSE